MKHGHAQTSAAFVSDTDICPTHLHRVRHESTRLTCRTRSNEIVGHVSGRGLDSADSFHRFVGSWVDGFGSRPDPITYRTLNLLNLTQIPSISLSYIYKEEERSRKKKKEGERDLPTCFD